MIVKEIVIHHSASSKNTTIEQLNAWHKARDFTLSSLNFYIGYHYIILSDGKVVQTRRDNELGCHVRNGNEGRLGICVVGNFMNEQPTVPQIESLSSLTFQLKKDYGIKDLKGHKEFNQTECPGENLYKWILQKRIFWLQQLINMLLGK